MQIGEKQSDDRLNEVLKSIAINQCCTIVYTVRIIRDITPNPLTTNQFYYSLVP